MVKVIIRSDSRFSVNRARVRQAVEKVVAEYGIKTATVGVMVVGDRKMTSLNQRWMKHQGTTDVLSFPINEADYLGDVVISYPQTVKQAAEHNKLVDDEMAFLVEHGMRHLMGEHHDDD